MAGHQTFQSGAAQTQQTAGTLDAAHRPQQLAPFCTVKDVAVFLKLSPSRIYGLVKGDLSPFVVRIGGSLRFRGRQLEAWAAGDLQATHINGELQRPRVFGRKRVG